MTFKLSSTSKRNMAGVHEDLKRIAERAIEITKVDFGIPSTGGLRTSEQQNDLFKKGVSKCDGYDKKSYHQTGRALDFYAYVDGRASWDELHLTMIATAFLQAASELGIQLEWGGLFRSFKDMPHVQLKKV